MPRKRVLSDHKQVGKRLIPRMAELRMQEQSWGQRTLPELIGIVLLERSFPGDKAAALTISLARAAHSIGSPTSGWFVTAGSFADFTMEQKVAIVAKLEAERVLSFFHQAFAEFAYFYPEFPLAFLASVPPPNPSRRKQFLDEFKGTLRTMFDKRGREAVFIQAYAIQAGFALGKLHVPRGSGLDNLSALDRYPDTEEALMVGASVCATINLVATMVGNNGTAWPEYFWNRGLDLDPCMLDENN